MRGCVPAQQRERSAGALHAPGYPHRNGTAVEQARRSCCRHGVHTCVGQRAATLGLGPSRSRSRSARAAPSAPAAPPQPRGCAGGWRGCCLRHGPRLRAAPTVNRRRRRSAGGACAARSTRARRGSAASPGMKPGPRAAPSTDALREGEDVERGGGRVGTTRRSHGSWRCGIGIWPVRGRRSANSSFASAEWRSSNRHDRAPRRSPPSTSGSSPTGSSAVQPRTVPGRHHRSSMAKHRGAGPEVAACITARPACAKLWVIGRNQVYRSTSVINRSGGSL